MSHLHLSCNYIFRLEAQTAVIRTFCNVEREMRGKKIRMGGKDGGKRNKEVG